MGCIHRPQEAPFLFYFLYSQSSARSLDPALGSAANKAMCNLDKVRKKALEKAKASEIEFLTKDQSNLDYFLWRRKTFKGCSAEGCG